MHFEGLSGAINVSIVAFSIVFGVLLALTAVIFGMKLFAGGKDEKKNDLAPANKPAPAKTVLAKPAASADKAKIVAAISAAIIEFTGNANFKILSVQSDNGAYLPAGDYWTSLWKTAGTFALNSNRLNRRWR